MVGIEGVSGVPDPASPTRTTPRVQRTGGYTGSSTDLVEVSPEAVSASQVPRLVDRAEQIQTEYEQERIAQARERIEEGSHKILSVLMQVAARVSKYIEI